MFSYLILFSLYSFLWFMKIANNVNGIDTIALIKYSVVRELMSILYPKKGKKGIGNRNSSHNPPIKRMNFHLSLNLEYAILIISFQMYVRHSGILEPLAYVCKILIFHYHSNLRPNLMQVLIFALGLRMVKNLSIFRS
jgi:hypothetical protein